MQYAFEDRDNLYLVIDLMDGGDLRFHIGKNRKFNEEQTSMLIVSLIAFRIFRCLHGPVSRVPPQELHSPQRH